MSTVGGNGLGGNGQENILKGHRYQVQIRHSDYPERNMIVETQQLDGKKTVSKSYGSHVLNTVNGITDEVVIQHPLWPASNAVEAKNNQDIPLIQVDGNDTISIQDENKNSIPLKDYEKALLEKGGKVEDVFYQGFKPGDLQFPVERQYDINGDGRPDFGVRTPFNIQSPERDDTQTNGFQYEIWPNGQGSMDVTKEYAWNPKARAGQQITASTMMPFQQGISHLDLSDNNQQDLITVIPEEVPPGTPLEKVPSLKIGVGDGVFAQKRPTDNPLMDQAGYKMEKGFAGVPKPTDTELTEEERYDFNKDGQVDFIVQHPRKVVPVKPMQELKKENPLFGGT